jgi:transcriptional regulator with XRE-family HTH domain
LRHTATEAERNRAVQLGAQLERDIRRAMPAAEIRSLAELARRARVQRDTLYAWFRGDQPPKPATLEKVAGALRVRLGDLWDYEAADAGPPPLVSPEAIAEIRDAVAAGVAAGIARVLAELRGSEGQPPPHRPRRQ